MSVRFGHAVMDENGKNGKDGSQIGDQTGKEIAIRSWYVSGNGWEHLLICKDEVMAENAAHYMEQICNDSAYGYSQKPGQRWSGYNAIVANGGTVNGASGDFDCASLCISCYILAGLEHKPSGYTGSMRDSLMSTGMFTGYTDAERLSSEKYARIGSLYLRNGHVAMALDNGELAEYISGEDVEQEETGDDETAQTEKPIFDSQSHSHVVIVHRDGKVNVRESPVDGRIIYVTKKKGEKLDYLGETDEETGWYKVGTKNGGGWITYKSKYVKIE